jgi:hypothetical protein
MLTSSYSREDIFLFCQIKMIFVYFVGTLDPALQDRDGQPRRNISTIAHILNDLLGASILTFQGGSDRFHYINFSMRFRQVSLY